MKDDIDIQSTIAIMSDLHCYSYNATKSSSQKSFLTVGAARVPVNRHPIQSLTELIDDELTADWRIRSKSAPHSGARRHPIPEHAGR
jgi:hypothetical protein